MITPQFTNFRKMQQFFCRSNNFTGTIRVLIQSLLNKIQQTEHVWNLFLNGLDMESNYTLTNMAVVYIYYCASFSVFFAFKVFLVPCVTNSCCCCCMVQHLANELHLIVVQSLTTSFSNSRLYDSYLDGILWESWSQLSRSDVSCKTSSMMAC